jgi:lipopolysaccharide transport system ATP-binding protein
MSTAIRIENVSKLYRLGTVGTGTISHDLNRWWHSIRGKEDPYAKVGQTNDRTQSSTKDQAPSTKNSAAPDYVWALRDVNLDVQRGEILGIIGRNGAGKSTLLKLLSRVTAPTTGSIKTKGRIASLLEVGTGFHPELTGRENIFLNGAILGMKRHEITSRLDEIVEFSGCAKYLDTPVKRYSSGMMVRLGFAVAAHLECEILIIDEVLAVGDWDFQKKCVEKMQNVSRSGRTLLFVSHNLGSVRQLCHRSVIMSCGSVEHVGDTADMIDFYMRHNTDNSSVAEQTFVLDLTKPFQVVNASVCGKHGKPQKRFSCSESLVIQIECDSRQPVPGLYGYLEIQKTDGTSILVSDSFDSGHNPLHELEAGVHMLEIPIPARVLGHGDYQVTANFTSRAMDAFNVDSPGVIASFQLYDDETRRGNQRGGVLSVAPTWNVVAAVRDSVSCGT